LHGLDKMQIPVALHPVDTEGRTQLNSDWGQPIRRDSGGDYRTEKGGTGAAMLSGVQGKRHPSISEGSQPRRALRY